MYRWGWEKTFYNKRKDVYFHIKIYKHVWKDHIFYIEVRIRIEKTDGTKMYKNKTN